MFNSVRSSIGILVDAPTVGAATRSVLPDALKTAPKRAWILTLAVLMVAALIYVPTLLGPHVVDDTDAAQAQIPRNMLSSGDWVTARLDGVLFLEKSPLLYWMMGASYAVFGVVDWAARLPLVASILLLTWMIVRIGQWAFDQWAGFYAGLAFSTSIGLFLFTRILIPDVVVTGTIALSLWAFLRALDAEETRPRLWAAILSVSMALGVLLKGVIGVLFPVAIGLLFLTLTGELFSRRTWQRLSPLSGIAIFFAIVVPWFMAATLANPPYFDFSMVSEPGKYRGFFWFYFFNEHILRFLDRRWPRDYDTVPRYLFWSLHALWFFPWSAYIPQLLRLNYRGEARAERLRLLCICWIGFVMAFFTFSTTQEYYSMPIYPAVALLLGQGMTHESKGLRISARVVACIASAAALIIAAILWMVWSLPTPEDISAALSQHPEMYTLSLGHMGDLTLASFAYLRLPLAIAGVAFGVGAIAAWRWRGIVTQLGLAVMMILFLNAARIASATFDPYLSSQPLADALLSAPPGRVVLGDQYYAFSSVLFYANLDRAYLLNGRTQNLEYGSYAPGAPNVFVTNDDLVRLWSEPERTYLIIEGSKTPGIESILGSDRMHLVRASGGKVLVTNHPLSATAPKESL